LMEQPRNKGIPSFNSCDGIESGHVLGWIYESRAATNGGSECEGELSMRHTIISLSEIFITDICIHMHKAHVNALLQVHEAASVVGREVDRHRCFEVELMETK
jgi:hypothetical protein